MLKIIYVLQCAVHLDQLQACARVDSACEKVSDMTVGRDAVHFRGMTRGQKEAVQFRGMKQVKREESSAGKQK